MSQLSNQRQNVKVHSEIHGVSPAEALEIIMAATKTEKYKAIDGYLSQSIRKIEELLPAPMKGQAERYVKRDMLTFARRIELAKVTQASFIRCVLEEIG